MLKRNLLKRVLPIILSMAIVFQSVPMTASAAGDLGTVIPAAADSEAAETPVPDGDNDSGVTEVTDAEVGADQISDGTAKEDSKTETSGNEREDGSKETADDGTGTDNGRTDEDAAQPGQDAQVAVISTEITMDGYLRLPSGFTYDNSESRLTYNTPYSENNQFGSVMNNVKNAADIKVNGRTVSELKDDYLILEWKEVKEAGDGTETLAAMTGTPQNVGSYALHLETRVREGICGAAEYNLYFNITKRKLVIALEGEDGAGADSILSVNAGTRIADFKTKVEKAVRLKEENGTPFNGLQYNSIARVFKAGDVAETTDLFFDRNTDYKVRAEVTLDAAAMGSYEVDGEEYLVQFSGLTSTEIDVKIKNQGSGIVKIYEKNKAYKTVDIATEYGISAVVKAEGSDHQYAPLGDDVSEADRQAVPKWYTKEINKGEGGKIDEFPTSDKIDGITQFYGQDGGLYTLMAEENVGDVGEYYLVYVYEGVDGRYDKSHSEPVKVTIEPIEVILVPTTVGELNTGMTREAVRKTLAETVSELRLPDTADATVASVNKSDAPAADKDFYGVSYDNAGVTQYYSPVFELVCRTRTRLPETQWPAGASEEQKWSEWTTLVSAAELKSDDDKTQYKYYIRFTGEKAVYSAGGVQALTRPVAEAADSANRNYRVKADSYTLDNEKNMLEVTPGGAAETAVDVSAVIGEFNRSGRGNGGSGLSVDDPAWTIFDPDAALFADRASYKKAVVTSEIKDTHKDISYTWQRGDLDQYYELCRMAKNAGETDEAFAERKERAVAEFEESLWDCSTSPYFAPYHAGIYRLHVVYRDSSLVPNNEPAEGDAWFLIKKQELMLVADTQYAAYGDKVYNFTKQGYRIYEIPSNDENALDLNSAAPLGWEVENRRLQWQVMNLRKNSDGSDSEEWEASTGIFIKNETYPYVYKAAIGLADIYFRKEITDTDGNAVTNKDGSPLYWYNYTTRNMAAWDAQENGYKQHYKVGEGLGDIKFDAGEIAVVVDRSKLFDDKIYDGKPIADVLPEGFVKLTDKATGEEISAAALQVNGEQQDGTGTVRVAWRWDTIEDMVWDENKKMIPTEEVRYGGVYTLVACFEGNDTYGPLRASGDWADKWVELADKDGPFMFEIKPLDVEISPVLKEEVKAGDPLSGMVEDWHVEARAADLDRRIPDGTEGSSDDRWLFERGDGVKWDAVYREEIAFTDSYPILTDTFWEWENPHDHLGFMPEYFEDNRVVSKDGVIRYGRRYDVKLSNRYDLFAQYAFSYRLTFKTVSLTNIVRGEAEVWETEFFYDKVLDGETITDEANGLVSLYAEKGTDGTYKIVPREGIPFVYGGYRLKVWNSDDGSWKQVTRDLTTGEEIPLNKNYIAVNIAAPREFSGEDDSFVKNHFLYRNSIKSAHGYVIAEDYKDVEGVRRYFITALFPVEADESGKIVDPEKRFDITWEDGYTDKFNLDLTDAKVEADLKKAVAPKALAFNGVQKKMAVGEEQQLDVRITKAQLGDVIQIRYRLSGGETSNQYASINSETGVVTALAADNKKPVTVNVEAYPVRLAEDGRTFEEITGKGVKTAKAKITVTEVTAPVIKKIIPKDISAEVQYTKVDNGYRREIYVVKFTDKKEAGKWTAADFEAAIDKMVNGQWQGIFAAAPQYYAGKGDYSAKLKLCQIMLNFEESESSAYAVYVRNVSAARTLADGSKVTLSSAGTVKTFETTKSQVRGLRPYFVVTEEKNEQNPVRYYNDKDNSDGYIVELADQSAQLLVKGLFLEKPLNAAADFDFGDGSVSGNSLLPEKLSDESEESASGDVREDSIWLQLSLKAAEMALGIKLTDKYQDPKLTYYVTDGESPVFDEKGKLKNPSKYVTINNKGKLTFKGVDRNGAVHIMVCVRADNGVLGSCNLTVTAKPDTLTVKKAKAMKVGDAVRLADYLEYKQGNAKVPYHWSSDIEIINREEVEAAGFQIYQAAEYGGTHPSIDGELRSGEYIIIAEKENSRCDLKFRDWLWTAVSDNKVQTEEQTISLSTSKLDPVRKLKVAYVDDKHITLNFAHAGHPEAFDIEVKDARGSIIYKKLAYREWAMDNMISTGSDPWEQNMQRALLEEGESNAHFRYFEKTKMYAYTVSSEKLMRRSSYTLSVTPIYKGQSAAKAAAVRTKTTNIPASYADCDIIDPEFDYGVEIPDLQTYLVSGNTYTLVPSEGKGYGAGTSNMPDWLYLINKIARERGTDTLIWKSSNAKVVSIKANPGSYTATLKALQQGKATVTVTSKVTRRTIARYHIAVKAVGRGSGYGGEYESGNNKFYDDFIKTVDPYYEGRLEVLTVSNPVSVTDEDMLNSDSNWDRTWVQFTAPSYGEYTFCCNESYQIYYGYGTKAASGSSSGSRTLRLEEGQKIYFRVSGTFTLGVSQYVDFTKLTASHTMERPLKVTKVMWVSFAAPEDNYYTFSTRKGSIEKYEKASQEKDVYGDQFALGMKADETVFIKVSAGSELYVTKRDLSKTLAVGDGGTSVSFTKDNAQETQYIKFRADVTGDYSFTYSPSDEITAEFLAVSGNTAYISGDTVVAPKVTVMADTTEPGTSAAPASETVSLFMESGETIVIAVMAENPAAITGDKKIDVTIRVATTAVKVLGSRQTVTKGTTQMFEYTIPDDQAATMYTVSATEGTAVEWYYSRTQKEINGYGKDTQLEEIQEIADRGHSFTVKEGKVVMPGLTGRRSLSAGDRIYIKVTADEAADAEVTLTSIVDNRTFDAAAPASVELGAKDGDAVWFTLTIRKAGYYEFGKKVTTAPAEAAAQSVEVRHVVGAFVDEASYNPYIYLGGASLTSGVKKLNAGSYVFMIAAASDAAEGVKTTVTFSVKEIVPVAVGKGDTAVTLARDEVKYYSFQAAANDKYTIQWTADADSGTAEAEYTTGDLENGSFYSLPAAVTSSENIFYIRMRQTGDKAVSGRLQVVADEKKFLTSGKEESFEIKENGASVEYTFTTPEDSKLGYIVTVENTSSADETQGQTMPTITVRATNSPAIVNQLGKGKVSEEITSWKKAFETRKITITADNVTVSAAEQAGISATGKIMIRPVTAQAISGTADKIMKADSKWYTCTIQADNRYVFDYAVGAGQDNDGVEVEWYRKAADGSRGLPLDTETYPYLEKGQELYANVKAGSTIADAGVDVTLKAPAALQTIELTFTDDKAEVDVVLPEGRSDVYYTFTAPAYAKYTTHGTNINIDMRKFLPDKQGQDVTYYDGDTLKKGEKILIKVSTAGKLVIIQDLINELKLNETKEITLKPNESAAFLLSGFIDGYYDFRVSDVDGLLLSTDDGNICEITENRCYFAAYISREVNGNRYEFTVENPDAETEAKLTVTAGKLEPVELKLGTNDVPVTKERISITEFRPAETYRYTFSCSMGNTLIDLIDFSDGSVVDTALCYEDETWMGYPYYFDSDVAGTAQVKVSKLVPAAVSGEKIALSLEPYESIWYAYRTTEAGEYTFTAPENVRLAYCSSLSNAVSQTGRTIEVKAGTGADIYLNVTNYSGEKLEGDAANIEVTNKPATELKAGESFSIAESGYTYLTFQAAEDGLYTFYTTSGSCTYYGENAWQKIVTVSAPYFIKKDAIVYLSMYCDSDSESSEITAVKTEDVITYDYVDVQENEYQWITFQAPYDGEYTFRSANSSGDPKAWLFKNQDIGDNANAYTLDENSDVCDDDSGGDSNFMMIIPLKAGETIYIAVGEYLLSNPVSCDVYVTC